MDMTERISQAKKPTGDLGVETLLRMNDSHEDLTLWALSQLKGDFSEILDVGCGGGATLGRLLKQFPTAQVHGIDYSPEGVALSKEHNAEHLGGRCHILEGSVLDLPYETGQFSLVTAFETIYFWGDYPKALGEVSRVLSQDGVFLVCCEMSDVDNPRWTEAMPLMKVQAGALWKAELEACGFSQVSLLQGQGEWFCLLGKK